MTTFSIETFQRHLQKPCTLHTRDGQALSCMLINVTSRHESEDPESKQFSVIRRGSSEALLGQSIYTVEMPDAERHESFLVPVGRGQAGILYEAVFA
ncbi:MAG: DUF6916 family protein [Methylococcales bacterium]